HVLGEGAVPVQLILGGEAVGEHEVDVAVLGVPEDHAVGVAVLVEQPDELDAGPSQDGHWHDDILEQRGGSLPAGPGHGGVQTLAQVPQLGAGHGVGAERRRGAELEAAHQIDANLLQLRQLLGAVRVVLHQEGRVVAHQELTHHRRGARQRWPTFRDSASISSSVATPVSTSSGSAALAACRWGNTRSAVVTWASRGMVRNTASATKPSVPSL